MVEMAATVAVAAMEVAVATVVVVDTEAVAVDTMIEAVATAVVVEGKTFFQLCLLPTLALERLASCSSRTSNSFLKFPSFTSEILLDSTEALWEGTVPHQKDLTKLLQQQLLFRHIEPSSQLWHFEKSLDFGDKSPFAVLFPSDGPRMKHLHFAPHGDNLMVCATAIRL